MICYDKFPAKTMRLERWPYQPVTQRFNQPFFKSLSTVGLWNTNIREAANQGNATKALLLFRQMKQTGLQPNNFTFPFVSKACGKLSNLNYSEIIHANVVKSPFRSDVYVQTATVDMFVKCNDLDHAYKVFERMPNRDVASWNAMLMGFAQFGRVDRVSILFREMRSCGIWADSVTVVGLTQSMCFLRSLKLVKAVHSFGIKTGIESDVSVANTWIAAYSKCGELSLAEMVFDGIDMGSRTVVSWNSMIAGYACLERCYDAIDLYGKMLRGRFRPEVTTILSLLSSCVHPEVLFQGKNIHSHGIQVGCDSDITVVNTLISMYCKCGDIDSARYLFDAMSTRSCVTWTAMIGGYSERGDLDKAMTLFYAMEAAGEKPDLVTLVYLVSGCGQMGSLELGSWFDRYAYLNGLKGNVRVCNALIDMYAKCGSISDAQEIFNTMPERTVVSWTTMITGCALNGKFIEALDLFHSMVEFGLKPNQITFLAALQACTHAGFLEEGWECFNLMTKVYKIDPGLDHYSCMADLLGRRGQLKEALDLVHSMPLEPDSGIWGALLAACKTHRNMEIGQYVAHRLFKFEPQSAVSYVEMANIYASVGRWDGVARIRGMMKCNKVRKFPGQSIVQVNGKPRAFTVEDNFHPETSIIYGLLDALSLHLKEEGFSLISEGTWDHILE